MHDYHPSILEHGFHDGCPGCERLVEGIIYNTDAEVFHKYWTLTNEFIDRLGGFEPWCGDLDRKAIRILENHIMDQRRIEERLARYANV